VVVGEVKSRFILAVPCGDEHAEILAKSLWERWFAVFLTNNLHTISRISLRIDLFLWIVLDLWLCYA
jgi:hypothetical protein